MNTKISLVLLAVIAFAIAAFAFSGTASPQTSIDPTDALDGSRDFADFKDSAEAGFMQIITLAWTPSMEVLDDYAYLVVERNEAITQYHTFAVSGFNPLDLRTNTGCYQLWRFDGRIDSVNYGEAFCVSTSDMEWLFKSNRAYFLAYRTY